MTMTKTASATIPAADGRLDFTWLSQGEKRNQIMYKAGMNRRAFLVSTTLAALAQPAAAATTIRFVTDWKAQAEHGGFYQAVADGLYAQRGLEVKIIQGGP